MKKTAITDDLIVFSDGFVWKRLSRKTAEALWNSVISHELELYWVRTDDESEAVIERFKDMERAFECGEFDKYKKTEGYGYEERQFNTEAEQQAYLLGLCDTEGWNRYHVLNDNEQLTTED
ncbi:hypothetical protein GPL01_01340 [Parabacteroides merdae]|uniref:hypothetical protein n=1 Tax=Parabacteroides merdae TaxID=46503 RepID=UPI001C0389EC|nr:hypothetical protein [Parabacteroides merdae]MBT9637522.1 hypothetical protein [Parabacteroides merdae]